MFAVVGRVALLDRFPHDFLAEDGLSIHDGRDFDIRGAQVEADAVAVQVAAQRLPPLTLLAGASSAPQLTTVNGRLVDLLAHEPGDRTCAGRPAHRPQAMC